MVLRQPPPTMWTRANRTSQQILQRLQNVPISKGQAFHDAAREFAGGLGRRLPRGTAEFGDGFHHAWGVLESNKVRVDEPAQRQGRALADSTRAGKSTELP